MTTPAETLFFITPIGEAGSPERRRSDYLVEQILGPVCADLGIQVLRADRIHEPTSLLNKILQLVLEADYAVCDFAFGRPNVYYECGVRHTTGKPILHLVRDGDPLPFDVRDFLTVFVDEHRPDQGDEVRRKVRDMLLHARDKRTSINPVTIAARLADLSISLRRQGPRPRTIAPREETPEGPRDWTGRWLTNFGLVTARQTGHRLRGLYQYHTDSPVGLFEGQVWNQWLLFQFPVRDSEVRGLAFLDTGSPDAYGGWVHTPTVTGLDDLADRLGRDAAAVVRTAKRWKLYGRVRRDGGVDPLAAGQASAGTVAGFHLGQGPGPSGRTLQEILVYRDEDLETDPGWVPWLFPDYGPEGNFPGLQLEEANTLRRAPEFQANLRKALVLVLRFYGFKLVEAASGVRVVKSDQFEVRKRDWVIVNHYHHGRITRILRSLNVFGRGDEAQAFCTALEEVQRTEYRHHLRTAVKYWRLAAGLDRG